MLIAGVTLLFTGRYPRGVFDLAMGAQRWALRVGVYAGLMTDEYPPFRLDMGGREPQTDDGSAAGLSEKRLLRRTDNPAPKPRPGSGLERRASET